MMLAMNWIIEYIDTAEQAVYLKHADSGVARRFCVPGAQEAFWARGRADLLLVQASTGYVWEIEPHTGRRRRRLMCCIYA